MVDLGQQLREAREQPMAHPRGGNGTGGPPEQAPENPAEIPEPEPEAITPEVGLLPVRFRNEAHGGVLKEGGTRGPGRPKNEFRRMLQGDLLARRQFILDVIDGKDFTQPGMFGPILAPAPLGQRVKAWGELAKYAIGPADPGSSGEVRKLTLMFQKE